MKLPFVKLEGLGNCYIFVEAQKLKNVSLPKLARAVSNVSTGIGSDGLIAVNTSREPHYMRIFNKDGSEAEMCGNGVRQAALFVRKMTKTSKKHLRIATCAGEYAAEIKTIKDNKAIIKTSMGTPDFSAKASGVKIADKLAFDVKFPVDDIMIFMADCVNMGNPHAVIWVNNFDFDWETAGMKLSSHRMFADGANIHFCRIVNSRRFEMKIYERGSGVTMACGSGAASCFAAGVIKSRLAKSATAEMPGGKLKLSWDISENTIYQEGPVSIVCRGEYFS